MAAKVAKPAKVLQPAGSTLAALATLAGVTPQTPKSTANLPADWIDGLAKLRAMPCPASVRPDRWRQVTGDAARFVADWGVSAAALGWETLDLFGCHPLAPDQRFDCMGVVWLMTGVSIVAVDTDAIAMRTKSGARQMFYRSRTPSRGIPMWCLTDLVAAGGPIS